MLKNKPRRQNRKRLAIDALGVERDQRDAEEISNGRKKPILVHLPGVEHLYCPGTAVEILGELGRFFAGCHASRHQKVDDGFVDCRTHLLAR